MVIAGAGGHALELLDILISKEETSGLFFYDEINYERHVQNKYHIIKSKEELKERLLEDSRFCLGVGSPKLRSYFYDLFISLGGVPRTIYANGSILSQSSQYHQADVFSLCYVGPSTSIGKGTLINTGAKIHHEVKIGDFSEISPGAILLGKCEVGNFCSIGAGATILPKIKIGHGVIVGAGTVVTRNIFDRCLVVGVPGKVKKVFNFDE